MLRFHLDHYMSPPPPSTLTVASGRDRFGGLTCGMALYLRLDRPYASLRRVWPGRAGLSPVQGPPAVVDIS